MQVKWYPGHMARALNQLEEGLKKVDVVLEILDARIPSSSSNPEITRLLVSKNHIILLNKADLADEQVTRDWCDYFSETSPAIPFNAITGKGMGELDKAITRETEELTAKWQRQGRNPRNPRLMVLGIPNVGKSALINRMAARKRARTGDKPGVTRGMQWIKLSRNYDLLDTPGILWPDMDDEHVALKLAITGAIKQDHFDSEQVGYSLCKILLARGYGDYLIERYNLDNLPQHPWDLLQEIGRMRGCLIAGGKVDTERAANLILREFQRGQLGRISLERPEDVPRGEEFQDEE
ncbi:MAG: ribosome biogenesis GTPase YlqF [Halanaerobium sp.]|nr:ribosome biogenesis GTPase YlqF [Halanaerobium sp.]